MARRRRGGKKKKDLIFLLGAVLLIAFVWGAFEFWGDDEPIDDTPPDPDSDIDGMLDEWERNNFGSLNQEPNDDFDNDGMTNLEEHDAETDPTDPNDPPPPPPQNITIPIWGFSANINYTFTVNLTIDGVQITLDDLSLVKQNLGDYEALPGNRTVNMTALNDTNPLYEEVILDFQDGDNLILEVWDDQLYVWKTETVPDTASCGA